MDKNNYQIRVWTRLDNFEPLKLKLIVAFIYSDVITKIPWKNLERTSSKQLKFKVVHGGFWPLELK